MSVTPAEPGSSSAGSPDAGEAPAAVLDAPPTSAAPAARVHRRRWPRVLLIIGIVLGLLAGVALAGSWYLAKHFEGNVSTIAGYTPAPKPASYEPVNFLIMGSDNRANGNSSTTQAEEITGQRSDTTLLVHVSGDRQRALVVSIPRDTLLQLPPCASESGRYRVTSKFNSAFTFGGPTCTAQAVQELTGIRPQHLVVIDFLGFKHVVDSLGGVDVCLTQPVDDPDSGLNLPAGWSKVTGDQALAFVRARKSLGDGSDIARIARQQAFLSSAIRQATDTGLLLRPVTLYRMLDAATKSLTVDSGIDQISEMAGLAESLRSLRPDHISFVTMPFSYAGNDVVVNTPVANEIWSAIKQDQPWPKPAPTGAAALTVAPAEISVLVANGNGKDNAATDAAQDLRTLGYRISGLAMADRSTYASSVVVFNPADKESARTLQASVPGSVLQPDPAATSGQLRLIVGADYTGALPVDVARVPAGTPEDPAPTTAAESSCSS